MGKLSEARLGVIGAQADRWPAPDASPMWKALHAVVVDAKGIVINADNEIAKHEKDVTLSVIGRVQKIGEVGKRHIDLLLQSDVAGVGKAEAKVKEFIAKQEAGLLAKPSERTPAPATGDDMLGAEIRAHVAKQEAPIMFAHRHRADPRVFNAIASAPAFLSGLSEKEHQEFLGSAAASIWPDQHRAKAEAQAALDLAQKTVRSCVAIIEELASAGLQKVGEGRYVVKGAKAA